MVLNLDFRFSFFQKRKHPDAHDVYENSRKRRKLNSNMKQELTQAKFDDLLQKFLVDGLKTYSLVEEPAFKDFVYGKYSNASTGRVCYCVLDLVLFVSQLPLNNLMNIV